MADDKQQDATSPKNPAADLIRAKLDDLYDHEPNAKEEEAEVAAATAPLSKHQRFMQELNSSGKSLVEIQTAWHQYYQNLPDTEKHEVWQEFYAAHQQHNATVLHHPQTTHHYQPAGLPGQPTVHSAASSPVLPPDATEQTEEDIASKAHHKLRKKTTRHPKTSQPGHQRSVAEIKHQLASNVQRRAKLKPKHHLQSIIFGLGTGLLVVVILLFGFFNERFIVPFISPSKSVSATPIIIDPNSTAVGKEPKIIIPKINVEIPVVYDEPSIDEAAVDKALERGVLHYATTPLPGEQGNGIIFGHSSNNILNKGRYKFAFVLLKHLQEGDLFYLQKDGKQYVYKVFQKRVVKPEEVSVLTETYGKTATFTLITCDPPGTSINRLLVVGEQISPDPATNTKSSVTQASGQAPSTIPSNAPSLWSRLTGWLSN